MDETYGRAARETTPAFVVARVLPELSRSCRLAIDLPVLGVLTWLAGGAKAPRRGVWVADVLRRVRAVFGLIVTDNQLVASLKRLRAVGLAEDRAGLWRPRWHENATVCRLDVALWRRPDLSPAAKRVHAVVARRVQDGRSDAIEWLAALVGMSRGRAGAAMHELAEARVVVRVGRFRSARGTWQRWGTGTQSEGVPQPHGLAATPKTRCTPSPISEADRWVAHLRAAGEKHEESTAVFIRAAGVGRPARVLTTAGVAGLARMQDRLAHQIDLSGTSHGTLAAWLLEHHARGWSPARACAALVSALGRSRRRRACAGVDLTAFVRRTGAERHLRDGARRHDVDAITAATTAARDVRGFQHGAACAMTAQRMDVFAHELARLDAAFDAAPAGERERMRPRYESTRSWLLTQTPRLPSCKPSAPTWKRTAG